MNARRLNGLILVMAMVPAIAWAHADSDGLGAMSGFLHPILGLDHLLAMLSVGIVSAKVGGKSIWTIPALFVLAMVLGGVIGINHIPVPHVELGIAVSVVALGLGIVFAHGPRNVLPIMAFVVLFGALHGHAHGVEAPRTASPFYYSFGFIVSTSVIHLAGVFVGFAITQQQKIRNASAYLGCAISSVGVYFIRGLL